ncbi:MAG TPA: OmpH family outer membrane protein [Pyrinomonadaceae bacterium]|nr:OmpH family outer membrane protein [Pyrinomonadaceae bacterium]
MKAIRTTFFAAALAATAALTASAQTPAQPRPAAPGPSTAAAIAEGKFAIIDTDAFGDQKDGIKRLVAAFQTVEREFKPRRDELQGLQTRYQALVKEVNDTKAVADQKALAAKADQAQQLEIEIKRKQEDGQKALDKRVQELTGPVYQDIGNALQAFAKARGLSVVFDVSKMQGVVMVVDGGIDITSAFIADYNTRNPATASAATPAAPATRP